ncbi:hypothetical protein IQ06DRAFT_375735 [Phaeosphaeriaceae sp. SRC1lsM3a]|nr:hypothetical protein IQ06DRAFT_375735 [Stagonospora sp. SRC1lsM3a]
MPHTRGRAATGADAKPQASAHDQENVAPGTAQDSHTTKTTEKTNRKRKSSPHKEESSSKRKSKNSPKSASTEEPKAGENESQKPRLSTPDIEFDYDRSQLRDPRKTPGRGARPRYKASDVPEELKTHLEATREIPKPTKPPGRLNAFQKDQLYKEESRMNPLATFHHLYQCYDKGPQGSPTYDEAGFQLDYDKVAQWMKPQAYNKSKMVRGMERRVEEAKREEEKIFEMFFQEPPKDAAKFSSFAKDYLKDHVSKDLSLPFHQIKSEQVKSWRDKGFQPVRYEEWWKEPNAEEKKRMMKMYGGASMRKDLELN